MLLALLLILVWYGVHYFALADHRKIILPPPHSIFTDAFFSGSDITRIKDGLLATSYLAFVGLVIAMVLGISIALIMNLSKTTERAIFPWAVVLQVIPIFALIPVIDVWFKNVDIWFLGFDVEFKKRLIVCVLIALFPIIVNTHFGLKSIDRNLHDLFTLHRVRRVKRFARLEFKAALPSIFVGLRIAAGLSVIGAIIAEYTFSRGGTKGIGTLIRRYSGLAQYSELIATILVSCALGVVIFWGMTYIGTRLTKHWHTSAQDLPA